ncbi:MAG: hypothetical protein P8M73_05850 [Luminiphilus sp.]|jgi:hypothetical protein|nr:hypothetical protein [Luminiphilus sp.]
MIRKRRNRTVFLAVLACLALFWGAIDIVGVSANTLWVHLGWVTLGVGSVVVLAAMSGWGINRLRGKRAR